MDIQREIFSQIYNQNIDKIYRFIFLKVNSQPIAEDLASETFLRGWETFKQDQNRIENPPAFLYQIARNLITDYYRERGKTQIISADCAPIIDPDSDLEKKAFLDSDLETIKTALAGLKEDYSQALVWRYIEDLPISEIAKMTNKSEGAVRVLLHRALKTLKEKV